MTVGLRWHGRSPRLAFTVGNHTWVGVRVALAHWLMRGVAMERNRLLDDVAALRVRVAKVECEHADKCV